MIKLYKLLTLFLISTCCYGQSKTMVIELDPALFQKDFAKYESTTALYCGQLSEMAYWKSDLVTEAYEKIKNTYPENNLNFTFLDNIETHAQALLWCTNEFLVISFRGTEPSKIKDVITDIKLWNYSNIPSENDRYANMPSGHGGFRKSLMELIRSENIFDEIDAIIAKTNPDANRSTFPIYLTGHSLGAAISQLFIECLNYKKYNFSGAYHFAPPLAVSCEMNEYMRQSYGDKVYDIVNYKDYIPRAGRNGVAHFGQFLRICNDGFLYKERSAYVKFTIKEYFSALKYHKLDNHLITIRDPENSLTNIIDRSTGEFPCMGDNIKYINPCSPIVNKN
ncbi:hypothetical protein ACFX5U_08625 [Sphingobacterium sp. SG20118]|uniref:lipase family protein n=1 Tax=Sphingobacterium sp. SG20118 TaxID=3367156 RepID=UPI0037DFC7A6